MCMDSWMSASARVRASKNERELAKVVSFKFYCGADADDYDDDDDDDDYTNDNHDEKQMNEQSTEY